MKAKELIKILQRIDSETIVCIGEQPEENETWFGLDDDMYPNKRVYWQAEGVSIVFNETKYYDEKGEPKKGSVIEIFG
jgi:hypothetical protein